MCSIFASESVLWDSHSWLSPIHALRQLKTKSARMLRPGGGKRVQRGVAILVILVVVREIFSVAHSFHPFHVGLVPIDGLPQAGFQRSRGLPPELLFHLFAAQGVPAIVPRTILYVGKQRLRLAGQAKQRARHGEIFLDVDSADVVHLTDAPALEHGQNSPAVILDVQPIALLLAVA